MHFVISVQSDLSRKIYLAITTQITQEDINLLLTKTTAARSSPLFRKLLHFALLHYTLEKLLQFALKDYYVLR